jgi:hypothetical protein
MEVTTNTMATAVQVRQDEDVLYREFAHKGMGQGLFKLFSYVGETQDAFGESNCVLGKKIILICAHLAEIIWDRLHAEAHKLQIARGEMGEKIPLYVTVSGNPSSV